MERIDNCTSQDLDEMAKGYYAFLTPFKKKAKTRINSNGKREKIYEPYKKSLLGRINSERQNAVNLGIQNQIDFWDFLLAKDCKLLKAIICSRPRVLHFITNIIDKKFGKIFLSKYISYDEAELTPFGKIVSEVFNYSTQYRSKDICIDNCKELELQICPYCNILSVDIIKFTKDLNSEEKQLALHQLDHFYPQVRYPYLALSFFNLIPGCTPCNAQLKREKDFKISTHFNPFEKSFDDFFCFKVNTLLPDNKESIEITLKNARNYPENAIKDFKILERYNQNHKLQIFNFLKCFKYYTPKVSRSHMTQFPDLYSEKIKEEDSLLEALGVPLEKKLINKYSLGKIKRDISLELDLLLK
ncbi:hypothetical protein K2F45_11520 [Sphingobacterium siyangense]|uniref:hypothetical protein n=1 Tax=Sphingobacterium siyangense TaxID=459529 RepID=UPI00200CECBB|nr:hypothetical protein [Sphingobacterium siyangense]UQA77565.1 hypothetical protein K2F45_11520 [Sphingobacterium siyangense]